VSIKNQTHLKIIKEIKETKSRSDCQEIQWVQKYLGTDKTYHGFSSKQMVDLAKKIITENNLSNRETLELINSLYREGISYTEIALAAIILSQSKNILQNFDPKNLDNWLNYTKGWAENDVLCQSNFSSDILLSNWEKWSKILKQFNQDSNINKRRASIVLLTKSLRQSNDPRFSKLLFQNIDHLKSEKDILITKAVSWGLRALVKFHKDEVLEYLNKNQDSLPKIAYREAFTKATTGRKYNNSKKQK